MDKIGSLAEAYGLNNKNLKTEKFGSGHIHATYLVEQEEDKEKYILQTFNNSVFKFPERISSNLGALSGHLGESLLPFVLPLPVRNRDGEFFTQVEGQLFRLFPFVEGVTKDAVEHPHQANLAAEAFGTFIKTFLNVPIEGIQEPIPDFHNLSQRYQQLQLSFENTEIIIDNELEDIIDFYFDQIDLLQQYQIYQKELPLRVTHSDTKINNLIFSEDLAKVNALIDLDTIMPGFIFYDFGDLARTVACTEDEASQNWNEIGVDLKKYKALIEGFCKPLAAHISGKEMASLPYGGEMMTYIMGLRFLADYLNGNIYYTIHYPEQNRHRAKNQMHLLMSLQEQRTNIEALMDEALANIDNNI